MSRLVLDERGFFFRILNNQQEINQILDKVVNKTQPELKYLD